jgi:hypothetical protein
LRGTAWVGRGRNSLSRMRLVVRLLGPLEVACGDRPVRIGAALGAVTQPPHADICPAQVLG